MKSDYINRDVMGHILFALNPVNRLVCKVALETGLRIGDILELKTFDIVFKKSFTIREQKPGKRRKLTLREPLRKELQDIAGTHYVFEHRTDPQKHRARQTVYADIKRVCKLFKIKENISPHSIRKLYAVDMYKKTGDMSKVQKALLHDNELTTMLYALSDILHSKKR